MMGSEVDRGEGDSEGGCIVALAEAALPRPSLYTLEQFKDLWSKAKKKMGAPTHTIERSPMVRSANSKLCGDGMGQSCAQYGRLLFPATEKLLKEILCVMSTDTFIDFGHGIGNLVLQAAYTTGCKARGLEIDASRNNVAERYRKALEKTTQHDGLQQDGCTTKVGTVELRVGALQDEAHHEFLTCPEGPVKSFCNNFNSSFADRAGCKEGMPTPDDHLARIFSCMQPGSILVTLHPLNLGPSVTEANQKREAAYLVQSPVSSFFEVEVLSLGPANDVASWSEFGGCKREIKCYKYMRKRQPRTRTAQFLCCNRSCGMAEGPFPFLAVKKKGKKCLIDNACPKCNKSVRPLSRRVQEHSKYK